MVLEEIPSASLIMLSLADAAYLAWGTEMSEEMLLPHDLVRSYSNSFSWAELTDSLSKLFSFSFF